MVANTTLDRNLGAMLLLSGSLARELAELEPADGLTWVATDEGEATPSALYEDGGQGGGGVARALASRRTPRAEGARWAAQADLAKHAAFVVRGFGLGYHVAELVKRMKGNGVVMVFEPDKRLLRAVLERIDCTEWLAGVAVFTDPDDRGAIVEATGRVEPLIAMGTQVLDHPASMARLARGEGGSCGQRFMERFMGVVSTVRTSMASAMVQTLVTLRNCLQNIDHYAAGGGGEGIEPLRNAFKGRTAIVVSAGPSLQRNVDLLSRPGVADRFVIVAAQTVLKPLLARGIRPHFICALDYHEVSGRFYEGLTAEAVAGVTLVAEPKVNPVVPASFPGRVRMVGDGFLDMVLGIPAIDADGTVRAAGRLQGGTTVAHLCCYFARFMGCDPVCLIGQDLGFTDGQYYSAGAAIHEVWGAELNEFKTLETMEWQRIARQRSILRRETDHLGRPVYTDEQMHIYLTQFARDFRADAQAGRTTIDATEGGVKKPDTVSRTLADVVNEEMRKAAPSETVPGVLRRIERSERRRDRGETLREVAERLRTVRQGVYRIGELSRRAGMHLSEAAEHHKDQARVNGLIAKLDALRDQVRVIEPAWGLVQTLNQAGTFKRLKADRELAVAVGGGLEAMDRQARQIERDAKNVGWLADSADEMADLLDGTLTMLQSGGTERITRDPAAGSTSIDGDGSERCAAVKAVAVVAHDTKAAWWGAARDALAVSVQGRTPLSLTLERVGRAERVDRIVVATDDVALARRAAEGAPHHTLARVVFERVESARGWPAVTARAARSFAASCWRGGHNDLTVFDEAFDAVATAALLERIGGSEPVVTVGGSWCCVDPGLIDAVVQRHTDDPANHRFAFAHAAPGLGVALLDRKLVSDLASARRTGGLWGSIGGLLGYSPVAPASDVIGKVFCVATDAATRQTVVRAAAETVAEAEWLERAFEAAGIKAADATAAQIAGAINAYASSAGGAGAIGVRHVELRLTEGERMLPRAAAEQWIERLAERSVAGTTLTLRDAHLSHPDLPQIVAAAKRAAVCVHVRTDLCGGPEQVGLLRDVSPDVVSVDCHADSAEVYTQLTGRPAEAYARLRANLESLMDNRREVEGGSAGEAGTGKGGGVLKLPLVVPRLTRRDAVYGQVEEWYDRHLLACGWAVLDPLETPIAGDRITPLPPAATALARLGAHATIVHADGRVEGTGSPGVANG